jgi:hypothetical protein
LKRSPQRRRTPQSAKGPSKPSHPQALIPFLQGLLPTLKRARRRIAEAIIRDPEDFIAHSIAELAAGARVSPGSIVMFCQSLGLKGLPALKMALARELSEPLFVSRDPIRNQDSDATTLQKVFDEHIRALQETLRINSAGAIAAGFITGLLEKWPLEKTLRFASAPWVPPAPAPWVARGRLPVRGSFGLYRRKQAGNQ